MVSLITEHIEIWTTAQTQKINGGRGRGQNSNGQSPHGIKKLRELILELAVRGKLVPQNPDDEPASALLQKIAKEKARLIKEGEIKKQKPLPEIGEDEKPFELPEGWVWQRLGEIGYTQTGGTPSKNNKSFFGNDVFLFAFTESFGDTRASSVRPRGVQSRPRFVGRRIFVVVDRSRNRLSDSRARRRDQVFLPARGEYDLGRLETRNNRKLSRHFSRADKTRRKFETRGFREIGFVRPRGYLRKRRVAEK